MSLQIVPGEYVRFRLSPEGTIALEGVFDEASFEANVAGVDELGIWIDLGDQSAMLVKWQYLATAVVPVSPQQDDGAAPNRIGFSA